MTSPPASRSGRRYAREVERLWSRLHGRPVVISPRDWLLICDWHAREVPLRILESAIEELAERGSGRAPPRSLAYLAPAVEESWQVVIDGRRAGAPAADAAHRSEDPVGLWRRRMEREPAGSPLAGLLGELLAALASGEPPSAIERRLDRELASCIEPSRLASLSEAVRADLRPFAERMDPRTLEETVRLALAARLRQRLGLPALATADGPDAGPDG